MTAKHSPATSPPNNIGAQLFGTLAGEATAKDWEFAYSRLLEKHLSIKKEAKQAAEYLLNFPWARDGLPEAKRIADSLLRELGEAE